MLSFLIPSYNYNCTDLVFDIHKQAGELKKSLSGFFDFEILVADDCSTDEKKIQQNSVIESWEGCRFFRFEKNMGRARTCNFLAMQAKFDYLVLMDCDALVCTDDFVKTYWGNRDNAEVVCGSLRNPEVCPTGGELRFFYEKEAMKRRTVAFRMKHPYAHFTTFNVLFHREVFSHVQFDERCVEYGYEDVLMGVMLGKNGYAVSHIENPLVHNGIDPSAVYLKKVETSLRVLNRLGEPLQSASPLVRMMRRIQKVGLLPLYRLFYRLFQKRLYANLIGLKPSMFLFKLYKLGYYIALNNETGKKKCK